MIALNALTLNAPDASSLTPQVPGSAQSIISSDPTAQDFSALLTELVGTGPLNQLNPINPNLAALSQNPAQLSNVQNTPQLPTPAATDAVPAALAADPAQAVLEANAQRIQQACMPKDLKTQDPADSKKTTPAAKTQDSPEALQTVVGAFVTVAVTSPVLNDQNSVNFKNETSQTQKLIDPANTAATVNQPLALVPQILTPEMQRAWADVKKFELNIQMDTQHIAASRLQPQVGPVDPQKEAIVTTDPIANLQLQQLPPRITAIEKLAPETKLADREKPGAEKDSFDTPTTTPTLHFADVTRGIEQAEQIRPAQPVEIPQTPHVQVVRTVAMEVGEADSQVTVRIQERSGDITLQINAANEPLHQDLQSSVGSLVHALRQEQVHVSNVDVSRKAPIEKVRRMKEAHS